MFLHDPAFFVYSLNPGVRVNEGAPEARQRNLRKIVAVEHQDLSTAARQQGSEKVKVSPILIF